MLFVVLGPASTSGRDPTCVLRNKHLLARGWAGGTEYGVNFVLLNKFACFVLCVTSFPFVIFPVSPTEGKGK